MPSPPSSDHKFKIEMTTLRALLAVFCMIESSVVVSLSLSNYWWEEKRPLPEPQNIRRSNRFCTSARGCIPGAVLIKHRTEGRAVNTTLDFVTEFDTISVDHSPWVTQVLCPDYHSNEPVLELALRSDTNAEELLAVRRPPLAVADELGRRSRSHTRSTPRMLHSTQGTTKRLSPAKALQRWALPSHRQQGPPL